MKLKAKENVLLTNRWVYKNYNNYTYTVQTLSFPNDFIINMAVHTFSPTMITYYHLLNMKIKGRKFPSQLHKR